MEVRHARWQGSEGVADAINRTLLNASHAIAVGRSSSASWAIGMVPCRRSPRRIWRLV